MKVEYSIILLAICFGFSIVLSLFIVILWLSSSKQIDIEKISAYECGFHSSDNSRYTFHIRFYLVSILFLIFDLELVYLFPWLFSINYLYLSGYLIILVFIVILIIGFLYEWLKGALEWE